MYASALAVAVILHTDFITQLGDIAAGVQVLVQHEDTVTGQAFAFVVRLSKVQVDAGDVRIQLLSSFYVLSMYKICRAQSFLPEGCTLQTYIKTCLHGKIPNFLLTTAFPAVILVRPL